MWFTHRPALRMTEAVEFALHLRRGILKIRWNCMLNVDMKCVFAVDVETINPIRMKIDADIRSIYEIVPRQ